jgi:uncharacterized membrane protein YfcA
MPQEPKEKAKPDRGRITAGGTLVGVSAGLFAVSGVFYYLASQKHEKFKKETDKDKADKIRTEGRTDEIVGGTVLGLGGGCLGLGIYYLSPPPKKSASAAPREYFAGIGTDGRAFNATAGFRF